MPTAGLTARSRAPKARPHPGSNTAQRPGDPPFTERTPRVAAARQLTRRVGRQRAGRFLAEGAQAVREALAWHGVVHELFVTQDADATLVARARERGITVSEVTVRAAAGLSETVTPQGIVAVCELVGVSMSAALAGTPRLVAVLVGVADPGNAGTVIRVADAAGADAVILAGQSVDPHNGKCVRASAGSLFHVPIARADDANAALAACRAAGLRLVAADGGAATTLDAAAVSGRTAWIFGNEAHGLPASVTTAVDEVVRVPIYGAAESLNLATAAAICLYTTARHHQL